MSTSYVLKTRGGRSTYVKRDGTQGTAGKGALVDKELAYTVAATQDQTLIQPVPFFADTTPKFGNVGDPAYTLAKGGEGGTKYGVVCVEGQSYIVRKLTPVECERLQGFPDDWTKVSYRGKPAEECPDTPRYKALGNSMAIPVIEWLGKRIAMVDELLEEKEQA